LLAYIEPVDVDSVFRALADPTRRKLLDSLHSHSGQSLSELCAGMKLTRQAVTQHIQKLEYANLVSTVWQGREKLHYLNPVPIQDLYDRWIHKFQKQHLEALQSIKRHAEET
jgi:DNA-binding transcriptional ArsR family regulator